jgi:hypothetical protein
MQRIKTKDDIALEIYNRKFIDLCGARRHIVEALFYKQRLV